MRGASWRPGSGSGSPASVRPTRSSRWGWRYCLPVDVRCGAVHRLEQRRKACGPGSGWPRAQGRSCRLWPGRGRTGCHRTGCWRPPRRSGSAAARSERDRISMCCLSTVTSGKSRATASARPSHHGMLIAMPLLLVATVRCLRGRARASFECESQHAVGAVAREDRLLDHDLAFGALVHHAAQRGVFALGVLAHNEVVDIARLASR